MKKRLNIALILSGAMLFFTTSTMQAQSSTVKAERGLEVKTPNAGSAQFMRVTNAAGNTAYDFEMIAQEDMTINETNVGSRIYIKKGGNIGINNDNPQATLDVNGDSKFVGRMELINAPGKISIFIGRDAGLNNNVNNGDNIFVGFESGLFNDTGSFNTFLGTISGRNNTTGSWNTFLGRSAGFNSTTGSDNTFVGKWAGLVNTVGSRNTFLGTSAGLIALGDSTAESIAIGYNAKVECSNCAVIGGTGDDAVKVGIGLTIPEAQLDVNGTARIRDLPIGTGDVVVANLSGDLLRSSSSPSVNEQRIDDLEAENKQLKARLDKMEQMMQTLAANPSSTTITTANITDATLQQNAPNPFTEATNIDYFIPEGTKSANLQVMDQHGRIIKIIPIQATGNGQLTLQANLLSAGTYRYSLILDGRVMETKQMVLTH